MSTMNMIKTSRMVVGAVLLAIVMCGCTSAPMVSYVSNPAGAIEKNVAFDSPIVKLNYLDGAPCTGVILSNNEVVTSNHCLNHRTVSRINDDGEMRILSAKADFSKLTLGTIMVDTTNNRMLPRRGFPKLTEGLVVSVRGYGCSTFVNGIETTTDKVGEIINYNDLTGVFEVMSMDYLCVGDSGAAVYSQSGRLIGVVASKVDQPTNLFQVVDVSWHKE